jgi:hypothetical protein
MKNSILKMKDLLIILICIFSFENSQQNKLNVTIELSQINSNIKVTLTKNCSENKENSHGLVSLPYYIKENNSEINYLNLGFLTLSCEQISFLIYVSFYENKNLTFNTSITVLNDEWNITYKPSSTINFEIPTIDAISAEQFINFINLTLRCSNCKDSHYIIKNTEIPDYSFYLSREDEKNISYLYSCSNFPEIKDTSEFIIRCIPFSPGKNIEYTKLKIKTTKIGFIKLNENLEADINYINTNDDQCKSLFKGDSVFYDIYSTTTETFTLRSVHEMKQKKDFPSLSLYLNDTENNGTPKIVKSLEKLCGINKNDPFEIICDINNNYYRYKKNKEGYIQYLIYEEKKCGKAFTGVTIIVSSGKFIKSFLIFIFVFFIF